jgi:hypothetical protein
VEPRHVRRAGHDLRTRAEAGEDLAAITGHLIEVEPAWSV